MKNTVTSSLETLSVEGLCSVLNLFDRYPNVITSRDNINDTRVDSSGIVIKAVHGRGCGNPIRQFT